MLKTATSLGKLLQDLAANVLIQKMPAVMCRTVESKELN